MLSDSGRLAYPTVMLEGEKHWGVPVVIGGDNLPSPVGIGLTDLPNIGGPSGITEFWRGPKKLFVPA